MGCYALIQAWQRYQKDRLAVSPEENPSSNGHDTRFPESNDHDTRSPEAI